MDYYFNMPDFFQSGVVVSNYKYGQNYNTNFGDGVHQKMLKTS